MNEEDPVDWPRRSETDPVPWDLIDQVVDRMEQQCIHVFEEHADDLSGYDYFNAVSYLYNTWKHEHGDETAPEQGAIYLFAYLVEKHEIASPSEGASGLGGVADRKPDEDTLRRLFCDEEQLPWWIAVKYGVHYTLVLHWMREEGIPYMRRNLPEEVLDQIDALDQKTGE